MKTSKLGKILAVALFVMLFAALLTLTSNAATTTVTTADQFTSAVTNAAAGDTITVNGDITLSASLTVTKNLTINGTGTVTGAAPIFTVNEGATLTLGGAVTYKGEGVGVQINGNNTTVNFKENVRFEVTSHGYSESNNAWTSTVTVSDEAYIKSNWAIAFQNGGTGSAAVKKTVTITGGTFEGNHGVVFNCQGVTAQLNLSGLTINNVYSSVYVTNTGTSTLTLGKANLKSTATNDRVVYLNGGTCNLTVDGTTITSANYGIQQSNGCSLANITIESGTITAAKTGIRVESGAAKTNLNLYGGTVESTGDRTIYFFGKNGTIVFDDDDGKDDLTLLSNAYQIFAPHIASSHRFDLTINGGTYTVKGNNNLIDINAATTGEITIKGGTFTTTTGGNIIDIAGAANTADNIDITINGGTFNPKSSLIAATYNTGAITVNGGVCNTISGHFIYANNYTGSITVNDVTVNGNNPENGNGFLFSMNGASSGTFVVKGGTYISATTPMFGTSGGTYTLAIQGGTFNVPYLINCNSANVNATVNVTGNPVITCRYGLITDGTAPSTATVNLNGGTISTLRLFSYATMAVDCKVTVGPNAVLNNAAWQENTEGSIRGANGTYYSSLQAAIDDPAAGDTITITGSFKLDSSITISRNLTITGGTAGQNNILVWTHDTDDAVEYIIINEGLTVTFSGSVSLMGVGIQAAANTTVNLTDNFAIESGGRCPAYQNRGNGNVTVNISGNAALRGSYAIQFTYTADDANEVCTGTKTVNMTGGTLSGAHGIVTQACGISVDLNLTDGKIQTENACIYIDNLYVLNNNNVFDVYCKNMTLTGQFLTQSTGHASRSVITVDEGCVVTTTDHCLYYNTANSAFHNTTVNIKGGTLNCISDRHIIDMNDGVKSTINISGGTFNDSKTARVYIIDLATNCEATIHVTGGTVVSCTRWANLIKAPSTITMDGGVINCTERFVSATDGTYVDFVIDDATVSMVDTGTGHSLMFYTSGNGGISAVINGGTFVNTSTETDEHNYIFGTNAANATADITLNGGTFEALHLIWMYSGTMTFKESSAVVYRGENNKRLAARIADGKGGYTYYNLATAISKVQDGETIEIMGDLPLAAAAVVGNKKITITGTGVTVSSTADQIFRLDEKGELTITGSITFIGDGSGIQFNGTDTKATLKDSTAIVTTGHAIFSSHASHNNTLVIDGNAVLTSNTTWAMNFNDDTESGNGTKTITATGGNITGANYGIVFNLDGTSAAQVIVHLDGTSVTATTNTALWFNCLYNADARNVCDVYLKDVTVTAGDMGLNVRNNNTRAKIVIEGEKTRFVSKSVTFRVNVDSKHTNTALVADYIIKAGYFESLNSHLFQWDTNAYNTTLQVTGGTFKSKSHIIYTAANSYLDIQNATMTAGDDWINIPSANAKIYIEIANSAITATNQFAQGTVAFLDVDLNDKTTVNATNLFDVDGGAAIKVTIGTGATVTATSAAIYQGGDNARATLILRGTLNAESVYTSNNAKTLLDLVLDGGTLRTTGAYLVTAARDIVNIEAISGTINNPNTTVADGGTGTINLVYYAMKDNGDGTFTFAATIAELTNEGSYIKNKTTNVLYAYLVDAIAKASKDDTLEIVGDLTLYAPVLITKSLTLTGGESTVTGGTNFTLFEIGTGAHVTFGGSVKYVSAREGISTAGDNTEITFCDNVRFETAGNTVYDFLANCNVTVNIRDNAYLKGNWVIDFEGDHDGIHTGTKTVNMSGGTIDAQYGIVFNVGGVKGILKLTGGTITATKDGLYLNNQSTRDQVMEVLVENMSITANTAIVSRTNRLLIDLTIRNSTIIGKSDCAVNLLSCRQAIVNIESGYFESQGYTVGLAAAANKQFPSVLNIYGGYFLSNNSDAVIEVEATNSAATAADCPPVANIYAGYFDGHKLCCARATKGGILNVYGGYFNYTSAENSGGSPIRSGTGSEVGHVYIYGGTFASKGIGASFHGMNAVSELVIYGAVNSIGGQAFVKNVNTTATGGTQDKAFPEGDEFYNGSIYMNDGAGVRIFPNSNGLRFVGIITGAALTTIEKYADAGSISFGTLISPADIVAKAPAFTMDAMDRAGLKYVDIPAENGLIERADGGYYIRAALINIHEENLDREFAAVSYVKYTVDGHEVIQYALYREHKNARNIQQVARLALKDADMYTPAQLEVLQAFAPTEQAPVIDFYLVAGQSNAAGCSYFNEAFANIDPNFTKGYSNIYYSGMAAGGYPYATKYTYDMVPMRIGFGSSIDSFGPELGMAKALSQYYNEETGRVAAIIKYAYGGTALHDTLSNQNFAEGSWIPPSWLATHEPVDADKSGGLFRAFVKQIEGCIADYEAAGYDVNIVAAYWMQGESDVGHHATNGLYDDMFKYWVEDLRASVVKMTGDNKYYDLPILVGEISEYFNRTTEDDYYRNCVAFVEMQREIIGSWDNVYVIAQGNVATADYPNDNAHWGAHDHLWNGQMVGQTILTELLGQELAPVEDPVAEIWLDGKLISSYDALGAALSKAPEGATVKLLKDIELYSTLVVGNRNTITLDGGNHRIDFKPTETTTGAYTALKFYATDITVKDLHVKNHTPLTYGAYFCMSAKVTWIGGSLEAERHGFVMNAPDCSLHIVSGDFKIRTSDITYAAVLFTNADRTSITVDGGTFSAGEGTGYVLYVDTNADNSTVTLNGGTFTAGTTATYVLMQKSTTATLIVKDAATLNGGTTDKISNAGKSE